jgi:mxaJ protein
MRHKLLALALFCTPVAAHAAELRVCADPNNLPFSNRAGQGFENAIAALMARGMGMTVSYAWAAQHETFVKRTLNRQVCDVMMEVPAGYDEVAATVPYYASTYVFVTRRADGLDLSSMSYQRLRRLKIGVHLIGDDSVPPEAALGQQGIVNNVRGFMIYGDYAKPNPPARLIEAVEHGDVDVAAVWGPLGGYFAKHSPVPLRVTPITGTARFAPLVFRYAIAMGVRKGDTALRDRLNAAIARNRAAIDGILKAYGVPRVKPDGGANG